MGFMKVVKYTTLKATGKFVLNEVSVIWTDECVPYRLLSRKSLKNVSINAFASSPCNPFTTSVRG